MENKLGITITASGQISPDDWQLFRHTKVFGMDSTVQDILTWAKSIDKDINFSSMAISNVYE